MSNEKETTNRRILVIDDNPEIFNDFKTILTGEIDTSALDAFNAELFGSEAGTLQKGISYQLDYASQGREGYEKVKRALAQERPYQLALLNLSTESTKSTAKINVEKAALKAAELSTLMLTYVGQNYVTFSSINLADIVEDTIKSLEESIPENISMTFQPVRPFPEIEAIPDQVRQVAANVFANALEAIGENRGTVTVAAGVLTCDRACLQQSYLDEELPEGDYVYLEVSDTGCGMDEEMKSKIFDPYFTTKFTGRGLGLAVVWGIVRGHRGAILVDSEPGKGTAVRVLFPLKQENIAGDS